MKKFENVIIASDMDGTFITNHPVGMARNRERIAYFKENGGYFTFASGRTYQSVIQAVPDVSELTNAPVVVYNGACLYDYTQMREIENRPLAFEPLRELIEFLETTELAFGCRMTTGDKHLFYRLDYPLTVQEFDILSKRGENCLLLPLEEWQQYPLYRMTLRAEDSTIHQIIELCEERFRGRLMLVPSEPTMMDVQDAKVNKAVVLRDMVNDYFDRPMFLCAIGDYNNDLEMLKNANLACCPANALDSIKAVCHHTLCHKDQGVVADVIDLLDTMF
ncbi:MAG: HAD hydrolase family protein [Clostridia bacterium]|nr:HAD hydrolase family protein [Clostridia bacterium]